MDWLDAAQAYWVFNKEGVIFGAVLLIAGAYVWGVVEELGHKTIQRLGRKGPPTDSR